MAKSSKAIVALIVFLLVALYSPAVPYDFRFRSACAEVTFYKVTATAYNATTEQCGKGDGITYTGAKVCPNRTIAVSRKLKHLIGRKVMLMVDGRMWGTFIVEDLMASHKKGKKIDIYMADKESAVTFGVKKGVLLILVE